MAKRVRIRLPRRARLGLFGMLLVAVFVAADYAGLFGQGSGDVGRYDGKTFLVIRDVDGDTFRIAAPDGTKPTTIIRLWGVDTPETKHPTKPVQYFGPEASEFTRRQTSEQFVRLQLVPQQTRDRHGRLLAYVFLPDGQMLNRLLIQTGHATATDFDHPLKAEFYQLEKDARRGGTGLWAARPAETDISPASPAAR
jgi:micrococcal nuclease